MTTLRDIFAEANPAAAAAAARLYECDKEWLPEAIANTLAELRRLAPDTSSGGHELHIEFAEPLLPEDAPGWDVWIRRADDPTETYSYSLSPWEEWLAVTVPDTLHARMSASEIAAHCIWDMTFHGWTRKQIAAERAEFDRRVREIDAGGRVKTAVKTVKTKTGSVLRKCSLSGVQ